MDKKSGKRKKSWTVIKEKSAETVLMKEFFKPGERNQNMSHFNSVQSFQKKRVVDSVFVSRKGSSVGGGTSTVLNALAAYLRYLEGTARDDWQE